MTEKFSMPSKYKGFCVICKTPIEIGEQIQKDEATGKWVHVTHKVYDGWKNKKKSANPNALSDAIAKSAINVPLPIDTGIVDTEASAPINMDWTPSKYQQDIFDFIGCTDEEQLRMKWDGKRNAMVEAVAGSGKTSTIIKSLEIVPRTSRVAFLAFNKHIAKTLSDRCTQMGLTNIHASTIHSLGLQVCRKLADLKRGRDAVDEDKIGALMESFWPVMKTTIINGQEVKLEKSTIFINRAKRGSMRKIISLAKATLIDHNDPAAIAQMMERYGVDDVDEAYLSEIIERIPYLMEKCKTEVETIDFDDQIWLPLVHTKLRNHFDKFDYIFVDEAQDLNNSQIQFILKSAWPHTRIICVGDRRQSLYGFRGADTEAIPRLIEELNAVILPLSISYRCPRIHIERAKNIVPQIEASDTAIEGKFGNLTYKNFLKDVKPGDIVMCRTNAPLVKPAFELIRLGIKAVIRGKDIGSQLVTFIEKFQTNDLGQMLVMMEEYTQKEYSRLMDKGKELQAELVKDKADTIKGVADECRNVADLCNKLEMLFSNSTIGVMFSSVHRAKGLEADRTFILKPELMPHPKAKQDWQKVQEDNTLYVAITRSKNEMYFVESE